jgi:hypothetical protein
MVPTSTALAARHSQRGRKLKFARCMNESRRAGSKVMASTAAMIMVRFLV